MYRHGDVIIVRIESIPEEALPRHSSVLARGEATGHSHRIAEADSVQLYGGEEAGIGYLRVSAKTVTLIHDEHGPIELPMGNYRFWQQREYTPAEIRRIVD